MSVQNMGSSLGTMQARQAGTIALWGILCSALPGKGMIVVPEDLPPSGTRDTPNGSGVNPNRQDLRLTDATRLTGTIVGHLTEQASQTANAAKAGRLTNGEDEPGVLDLTPLRELLAELVQELQRLRPRDRIAWALRQAADIIDPQTPSH